MRTPRLELSRRAQEDRRLNSAFAHFTFTTQGNTGFDMVRSVLRRRQGEQLAVQLSLPLLARAAADVSSMAFWRFVRRRLWIPRGAELLLQVDIEQSPNPNSRLWLADERDEFDRKRLVIEWQITPADVRVIREVAALAENAWQRAGLTDAARLELTLPKDLDSFESLYDVYHPTGPIRMGRTRVDSVVDRNLRLWAAENVYVTTTAVFPSAGSANPGFTHLALTSRLAQHLAQIPEVMA
jgi:choline dehydrogenase-like flavoprotein